MKKHRSVTISNFQGIYGAKKHKKLCSGYWKYSKSSIYTVYWFQEKMCSSKTVYHEFGKKKKYTQIHLGVVHKLR